MSFLSLSDELEINLNDSIEFIRNSDISQKVEQEPKCISDLGTDLSSDEKTSSTLSRKFLLINY